MIGLSQDRVSQLMNFGRFSRFILEDTTTVVNSETARFLLLRTREGLFRRLYAEHREITNTVQRYRGEATR